MEWIFIGPRVIEGGLPNSTQVSGRVSGIASNGLRTYVSTANGGVWLGEQDSNGDWRWTDRTSWDFDPVPVGESEEFRRNPICCGAIAVKFGTSSATDLIFVGTGDADAVGQGTAKVNVGGRFGFTGIGILRSEDGGANWAIDGLGAVKDLACYQLAIHPNDPDVVAAATTQGLWVRDKTNKTWNMDPLSAGHLCTSVVAIQGNLSGQVFYAAYIKPSTGDSGHFGEPNVIASSDGKNWTNIGDPNFILGNYVSDTLAVKDPMPAGRVGLAAAKDTLYALIASQLTPIGNAAPPEAQFEFGGLWQATWNTTSQSWDWSRNTKVNSSLKDLFGKSNQGKYDLAIAADGKNTSVFVGGDESNSDGARFWKIDVSKPAGKPADWGRLLHPDVHAITFDSDISASQLFVGTDGGLFVSSISESFEPTNNGLETVLGTYMGLQDPKKNNKVTVLVGTQDNGVIQSGEFSLPDLVQGNSAVPSWQVDNTIPIADGGWLAVGNDGQTWATESTETGVNVFDSKATGQDTVLGLFLPYSPIVFLVGTYKWAVGGDQLYFRKNKPGLFGSPIDPLSLPIDSAERVICLAVGAGFLYAGTNLGKIIKVDTANQITPLQKTPLPRPKPPKFDSSGNAIVTYPVTAIAVDPDDPSQIYAVVGRYGTWAHLFHYHDTGTPKDPWQAITTNLVPAQFHHNAVVVRKIPTQSDQRDIWVGTDVGVYRCTYDSALRTVVGTAERVQNGLKKAPVIDLKLTADEQYLFASTYGRGVYTIPLIPLPVGDQPPLNQDFADKIDPLAVAAAAVAVRWNKTNLSG